MSAVPAFKAMGDGPALVFLHGVGGNQDSFDDQLRAFSPSWRAVAWDMPGYGKSPLPERITWEGLAAALVALLDHLGAPRAVIVGHSMGGMVAQELSARHPGRLAALVLYATTSAFGGGDGSFTKQFLAERLAPLERGLAPADIAEDLVRGMLAPGSPPEALRRAAATMATVTPAGYRASLECLVTFDRRADLERIACPTLVLSASADKLAPAKTMARMAEKIPGARLTCLDGLGHLAHLEAPERFDAALADFLGTLDGRGCTRP